MGRPIEDYALLGDSATAALVSRTGSIDWWCPPRFDQPATFAALLGDASHGRWLLAIDPVALDGGPWATGGEPECAHRCYRDGTMLLETTWRCATGSAVVLDLLAVDGTTPPTLVRIVEGIEGVVPMHTELRVRFDYGSIIPWVRRVPGGVVAVGGADGVTLQAEVPVHGEDLATVSRFEVAAGQRVAFALTWHPAHQSAVELVDPHDAAMRTEDWWRAWSSRCRYTGPWAEHVRRSLLVLKALTYAPTGGIVAAPTTSLPEQLGGVRNWDYRYCWLRDASFTVSALLDAGYPEEAAAWARWLRRAVAGDPDDVQIMYGVAGERRLTELELDWLPGHGGATPVRIGNAAHGQRQLDVYGEVFDLIHTLVVREGRLPRQSGALGKVLMARLTERWHEPDDGIWEVRGGRRHFTHSKVMAWVAVDRWLGIVEALDLDEDRDAIRALADTIHADVCANGWNPEVGAFTQAYGSDVLDASLLQLPLVGFLPPDDPRVVATVLAIRDHLCVGGFVLRYPSEVTDDGLPPGEGAFLLTTCWLVEALATIGRRDEAVELFERVLDVANDVGLLAEEVDPASGRHLGNTPQAFSHLGVVVAAMTLHGEEGPVEHRRHLASHPRPLLDGTPADFAPGA